jgi:sec-independent protein translocase protein TatA
MGPIGVQEMIAIFLVALVLFGPKKLPELGRTIAKAITEFRRASSDLKATFEREMQSLERESESIKDVMGPMRTIPPQPILPQ